MRDIFIYTVFLLQSLTGLQGKTVYLAKDGNDANPGSYEEPYGSIAKATSLLFAGDTLYIREGCYLDIIQVPRSGSPGNPIVVMAYPGEKVVISALEPLSGWERDEGNVFRTPVGWSLGPGNLVMHGDTACDLARWPNNTDGDLFTLNSLRNTGGSTGSVISNAYLDYTPGIPDYDWSKGGSVFFYGDKGGGGWIAWKAYVKSNSTTRLTFDLNKNPDWIRTVHAPADFGDFYLEGIREAIDYKNEWFFDESTKVLYLQLPGGAEPSDSAVFMRKRTYAIKLSQNYIVVKNLEVVGGSIEVSGSRNYLYGIKSRWGNHHRGVMTGFSAGVQSVFLGGSFNIMEKCDIGYGAATGVKLSGSHNEVLNSFIHNFNFLGSYDAPVMARDGFASKLTQCTVTRGGRDAVHMSNNYSEMAYNDISRSNLIADDCGLFYVVGGPHHITIHHNWFHDTYGRGKLRKAAGIYLDNNPSAFEVHHNVVWNTEWASIQMNKDARDITIYNNTLWNASGAIGVWHLEGTHFERVQVYNNLANNNGWDTQTDNQKNLTLSSDPFVNSPGKDWQLKKGSAPIDMGRQITGITDGFIGSSPDAGAYEYGQPMWKAGIDWDPVLGPDACQEEKTYVEVEGVIVVEAESAAHIGKGWIISPELSSHGEAYLKYTGPDEESEVVDSTVSTYPIKISNPGTYRFKNLAMSAPSTGHPEQETCSWIHIECDQFFGMKNGVKHLIDSAFAVLSVTDTSSWDWNGTGQFEGSDSLELFATFTYSGIYHVSIAGKSTGYLIDRLVLYQQGRGPMATDTRTTESWTGCDEYSMDDPWPSPALAKLYYYADEFTIDGFAEPEWNHLPELLAAHSLIYGDSPQEPDISCRFRLSFNDDALFLFATVTDDVRSDEIIDLFINPDQGHQSLGVYGDDDIHLQLFYGLKDSLRVAHGDWKANDFSGVKSVTRDIEGGYIMEARIPWDGIYPVSFENESTTYMGFEFQVNDTDEGIDTIHKLAWANNTGLDMATYDTRKFGTISLIKDVELIPVRVTGVDIIEDTLIIEPGELIVLEAIVVPDSAENRVVTWQADDGYIVYLAPSTGHMRGRNPGTTLVTATTQDGSYTDSILVIVLDPNATTSIEDLARTVPDKDETALIPNPATESFRVEGIDRWTELQIFAMTGQLVLHLSQVDFDEYIAIDHLPAGLYLVRIQSSGKTTLKKFVIE